MMRQSHCIILSRIRAQAFREKGRRQSEYICYPPHRGCQGETEGRRRKEDHHAQTLAAVSAIVRSSFALPLWRHGAESFIFIVF